MKVDPNGRVVDLNSPELFDYPWIYFVEPGGWLLQDEEVPILRRYLLNGGFAMFDDFWGEYQYQVFYDQIKRVFPDREPVELPMSHPIFHGVFDIKLAKNQLQCPNIRLGERAGESGITWETHYDPRTGQYEECRDVHFKAIFDDKGRIMVFIAHNTDNGDGWEREGENVYYFKEFSEKRAYPLGINVIFHAMTH